MDYAQEILNAIKASNAELESFKRSVASQFNGLHSRVGVVETVVLMGGTSSEGPASAGQSAGKAADGGNARVGA